MVGERSSLKMKPRTETGRDATLHLHPGNGNGHSGHMRNISRSMIDGDLNSVSSQPGSPTSRKDQLQITNKKSQVHVLTRSSSTRHEAMRNKDLNNIKKPAEHHYMKTTKCFNAKSKRPIDLESPKVKKKPDPDPYGVRRKSDNILGFQRPKQAEPINPYSKPGRSRPSSVDSQSIPTLKRLPSLNSSRVPRQNRQGIPIPSAKKKSSTRQESDFGSYVSDHLSYADDGESIVKEIIKDNSTNLHSDKQEATLETDETEIKADMLSQASINEMELLEENGNFDLSFNPAITSGYDNLEKLDILCQNLPDPEIITKETVMEVSPKHPDNLEVISSDKFDVIRKYLPEQEIKTEETIMEVSTTLPDSNIEVISSENPDVMRENLPEPEIITKETIMESSPEHPDGNHGVITENKIMETHEVAKESISQVEKDVTQAFIPEQITRVSKDHEKQEVIETKYEKIEDLCVLSSSNDVTDDLRDISIESEVSKIISTENTHYNKQEQKALSIDIMSTIEEIANELEGMENIRAGSNGDLMHPTWVLKNWKVDYVLQRLIEKLEYADENKVSKLIQAYESVIQLMMQRMAAPHQASSQ